MNYRQQARTYYSQEALDLKGRAIIQYAQKMEKKKKNLIPSLKKKFIWSKLDVSIYMNHTLPNPENDETMNRKLLALNKMLSDSGSPRYR